MVKKNNSKLLAIASATIWIIAWEMLRNELLFKSIWVDHFSTLGLTFETLPINGILWSVWSFILAYVIYELVQVFEFKKAVFISWLLAFPAMWLVVYNLQTLPLKILWIAVPLSIIEVYVASLLAKKFSRK